MAEDDPPVPGLKIPWREAGWTEREAAAHLLDRFTFGARPGQVDAVVEMGLEAWLERQLANDFAEAEVAERLRHFHSLTLSASELARVYPSPGKVLREAQAAGALPQLPPEASMDAVAMDGEEDEDSLDRSALYENAWQWADGQGYRPQREVVGELLAQKLLRAVYAEGQLHEVLTDFWYNHLYVSLAGVSTRAYATSYERDVIRPNVVASFRELLGASARHPAMLLYLDNGRSVAEAGQPTTLQVSLERLRPPRRGKRGRRNLQGADGWGYPRVGEDADLPPRAGGKATKPDSGRLQGLNENYARELLELHTLGVDGGYSQADVVAVARAFTGWTVIPPGELEPLVERRFEGLRRRARREPEELGFLIEGDFLFRADAHDAAPKTVLGQPLAAGRGIEDGEQVLDLLAAHPATAHHLATRLALRFVSDAPPPALVDRLARTFTESKGDLRAVIEALVASPELWAREHRLSKVKSPFELVTSALRAVNATVLHPRGAVAWLARMGQPPYFHRAPTGYPETSQEWVTTGGLLQRMSFGLELAAGRVEGVRLDLEGLARREAGTSAKRMFREPESREEALALYLDTLLPERDHAQTRDLLLPLIRDPALYRKVAGVAPEPESTAYRAFEELDEMMAMPGSGPMDILFRQRPRRAEAGSGREPTAVQQVVGLILGAPAFQQR